MAKREARESRLWEACLPSSVSHLKMGPSRAPLSVQTKWSSFSIKEPLRSTRPATGCHCYSTHRIASQPLRQGLELEGARLPFTPPLTELPSLGFTPQASSTLPVQATSLPHCLHARIVLCHRMKGRKRDVFQKKSTTAVSRITGSPRVGL